MGREPSGMHRRLIIHTPFRYLDRHHNHRIVNDKFVGSDLSCRLADLEHTSTARDASRNVRCAGFKENPGVMYYTNLILQPTSGYFLRHIIIEVPASEVQDSNSVVINKLRPLCNHQRSLSSQGQECHTLCISINMEDRPLLLPHLSFKIHLQSRLTCYAFASKLRKFT